MVQLLLDSQRVHIDSSATNSHDAVEELINANAVVPTLIEDLVELVAVVRHALRAPEGRGAARLPRRRPGALGQALRAGLRRARHVQLVHR